MKFLILALLVVASCSSSKPAKPKLKYDANLICKLASLEYKGEKRDKNLPPPDGQAIRSAMMEMHSKIKECVMQERRRSDYVDEIALCYVVGTNKKGKITYSKFYSHDDKEFSKDFFKCLEDKKNRPDLSAFKSVKVTQPINFPLN